MEQPFVSIVVLTYFHEKYIAEALDSIISQKTEFGYEIIVADDCSQDATREIIKKYQNEYPDIIKTSFNETNLGITENLYRALLQCKGKYITLLAGDDKWIGENSLNTKIRFLEENPRYIALCTQIETRNESDGSLISVTPKKKHTDKELTLKKYLKGIPFHTHGFVMRNMLLTEEGKEYFSLLPKCSKYIDDSTLCLLVLNSGPVYLMGIAAYLYRYQQPNSTGHSFNATNTLIQKASKEIELYNNFHNYLPETDLFKLYKRCLAKAFGGAVISKNLKLFRRLLKTVPKEYRKRGVFIRSLPLMFKKAFKSLFKKFKRKK